MNGYNTILKNKTYASMSKYEGPKDFKNIN